MSIAIFTKLSSLTIGDAAVWGGRLFRTRFRIVRDNYAGYAAEFRWWWMPFYMEVNGINTFRTPELAEDLINKHRRNGKIVKQVQ